MTPQHRAGFGWYFTKSLLDCPPGKDINRRTLYRNDEKIRVFNDQMNEVWEVWQDEILQRICDNLNTIEERRGSNK